MPPKRVKLTSDELDEMMPPGEYVHTFMQANGPGLMLLGADWKRDEILKAAANGAELSGEAATRMKHGAVVWNEDKQPVFVATIEHPPKK